MNTIYSKTTLKTDFFQHNFKRSDGAHCLNEDGRVGDFSCNIVCNLRVSGEVPVGQEINLPAENETPAKFYSVAF